MGKKTHFKTTCPPPWSTTHSCPVSNRPEEREYEVGLGGPARNTVFKVSSHTGNRTEVP
jgi:hypothetical protein